MASNSLPLAERHLRRAQGRAERRARAAGIRYDLPPGYAWELYRRQGGRCAFTGLLFTITRENPDWFVAPYAPSLDRIRSDGPYTARNVRLITNAANFALGQWGDELYFEHARAAIRQAKRQSRRQTSSRRGDGTTLGNIRAL